MTNVGRVSAARFRGRTSSATTCVLANARTLIVMRSSNPAPSVPLPFRGGAVIRLAWMLRLSCRNHNPIAPRGGSCGLLARTWGTIFAQSPAEPIAHTVGANLNPPRPLQFTRRRVDGASVGVPGGATTTEAHPLGARPAPWLLRFATGNTNK